MLSAWLPLWMSKDNSFAAISNASWLRVCRPAGYDSGVLPVTEQYWKDSYGNIRFPIPGSSQESNLVELIHDAFQPLSSWNGFEAAPSFQGVMLDTHIYQMFSNQEVAQTQAQHIAVCTLLYGFLLKLIFWRVTITECLRSSIEFGVPDYALESGWWMDSC